MTIEELKVLITAETAGLEKEIQKTQTQLKGFEKNVSKTTTQINHSFKNLFKGVSFAAITLGLIKIRKSASSMASNLEEVQNVVQVTFGAASAEIDDFASKALKSFGLNELSAKKMASTYMAMSNGMGIAFDTGKEMSKTLTGLAGDMASFYNVSTDVADTALHSIFTGETESLKKFGIVMTEANLQQFAYSQGISKNVSQMTQAEKVALRYQYVIKGTAQAQGDFARTSGNWANQTRILKEQWGQLLGVIGKGLNAVLLPVVKAMNNLLASVIAVANAMSKAFGGSGIASASGKVESNIGGIQEGIGGVEEGFDDANESAKKLSKTVSGFDELNLLSKPEDSGSSNGGTGGGTGGSVEGSGSITPTPDEEGGISKLQQYLQECKDIIDKWKDKIPKLQFNFDSDKAIQDLGDIGKNILDTIAGWGSFVITIAIDMANDLDIGKVLESVIHLTKAFTGLGAAITDTIVPALQTFYRESGLQEIVKWIGEKLSEGLDGVAGKLEEWSQWFVDNREQINEFAENLGKALEPISQLVIVIADTAWKAFAETLSLINDGIRELVDWLIKLNSEQIQFLIVGLLGLISYFKIAKGEAKLFGMSLFAALAHPIANAKMLWEYFHDAIWVGKIAPMFDKIVLGAKKMALGILAAIKNIPVFIGKIIGLIKTAVMGLVNFLIANPVALLIAAIVAFVALIAVKGDEIQEAFNKISAYLEEVFATDWSERFGFLGKVMNGFSKVIGDIWHGISEIFNGVIDFIRGVFTGDWERAWEGVKEIFKGLWDSLVGIVKAPINIMIGLINGMLDGITKGINLVVKGLNKISIKVPEWVPKIGGKTFGFDIQELTAPQIPLLANGGVIDNPTVAMMGEYTGAKNNPEIVAPQNLIKNTVEEANSGIINAVFAMGNKVAKAVEDKDTNIYLDGAKVSRKISIEQSVQRRNKGVALVNV